MIQSNIASAAQWSGQLPQRVAPEARSLGALRLDSPVEAAMLVIRQSDS
jgi:hypothetical protein